MNEPILTDLSELFLALSDKTRLRLIGLMTDGAVTVGYLADSIGESQPKVSRHLANLRNSGLVSTRREGKNIFYSIEWPNGTIPALILQAITGKPADVSPEYTEDNSYKYVETDVNDYRPQEIEIHLL